jgi:hypothetical protein
MLAIGVVVSAVAGAAWTEQTEERTSGEFGTEAAVIAAAVSDGITRIDDLTIGARAKIVSDPVATNGELRGWYRSVDGHRRFPFARGFGYIESVPAARLSISSPRCRRTPSRASSRPRDSASCRPVAGRTTASSAWQSRAR